MLATAKLNYLRVAPRKVRLVADLIRGKSVEDAQKILSFTTKRAAPALQKLLKSALANAKSQSRLDTADLYIRKITVDEGPKLKRWMPRARGQAYEIQKKTSHVTLVLDNKSTPARRGVGGTRQFPRGGKQGGRRPTARNRGFLESEPKASD